MTNIEKYRNEILDLSNDHGNFCDDKIKNVIAWRDIEPFEDGE